MKLIWDTRTERLYPVGSEGFTSGSVQMIRSIAAGLASRGHTVHVVTADLKEEVQKANNLWYWPAYNYPRSADVAIMHHNIDPNTVIEADNLVLVTFGVDPYLGDNHEWAAGVDAFPIFSEVHGKLMRETRPTIDEKKCFVTGLGVGLTSYDLKSCTEGKEDYSGYKVPGRMLYANDPARGLFYLLDIFDLVKKQVPYATLHVAYDFDRNLEVVKWGHHHMAQMLLNCKQRIDNTEGIVNLGKLSREQIIREQLECQVHCMPSDPPAHDQIHGLTQMECAAAGAALVLSDVDAFPEVFGDGAIIMPVMGKYIPSLERRVTTEDYATMVIGLMQDRDRWQQASVSARKLAEANTWDTVIDKWEVMLRSITEVENV